MLSLLAKRHIAALVITARCAALWLCIGPILATPALGWEDCSHQTLTTNGIALLNGPVGAESNFYADFGLNAPIMRAGDIKEDTPKMAVVNHFYDAKTLQKLHTTDAGDNNILESVSLGSVAGVPFSLGSPETPQTTALARGADWLKKAARDYGSSRTLAYEELGRALHLMAQDVTQPAHVHNDPHVPYMKFFSWALPQGLNGSDLSPLEGKAETLCKASTPPNFPQGTSVPTIDPQAIFPELTLVDTVAQISYRVTTFVGTSPFDDTLFGGSGTINIGGNVVQVALVIADPSKPPSDCLAAKHFEIDPANPGDPDAPHPNPLCYNPAMKYAGTASAHFSNDWWNVNNLPPGDRNIWDPLLGANEFYFHFYNQVYYGNAPQTLNTYLLSAQLELATNYSAALLKLFANIVDRNPPKLSIQLDGASGPVIPVNGFSREGVYALASDPVTPNASGIGYLALEGISEVGNVASHGSIISLPSFGNIPNEKSHAFVGLSEGRYQIHAVDGLGNHAYSTFTVSLTVPDISLVNGLGQIIEYGANSQEMRINGTATTLPGKAPMKFIDMTRDGVPYRTTKLGQKTPFPVSGSAFSVTVDADSWYWIQACDQALNCRLTAFNTYADPSSAPGAPPPPDAPNGGKQHGPRPPGSPPGTPNPGPPTPPVPPGPDPQIPPDKPQCNPKIADCVPDGPDGPWPPVPKKKLSCNLTPRINCVGQAPHDPNALFGPTGSVTPGQLMTYKVEFENIGGGPAFDVYVRMPLDPALDDSVLSVRDFFIVNNSSGLPAPISTPTTFPYSYDSVTRTVTLFAGAADPHFGGTFTVEARLKSNAPQGTVVNQQAIVYFPSVLEVTPTNVVPAAVPLPTTLNYAGASTGTYLSDAVIAARLAAAAAPVAKQPVLFELAADAPSALTDSSGLAATSLFLSTAAGVYNLSARYPGDNFYYLPSQTNATFSVEKRATRLQAPFAVARPTETVLLSLTLTDDQEADLLRQSEEPKQIHLELLDTQGGSSELATGIVSGSSATFQFALPQPLRLSWTLRARFDGDSRYASVVSTGVLNLLDDQPPAISIHSPHGGETFSPSSVISIDFSISDGADLAPSATAYLAALDGSQVLSFSSNTSLAAGSLTPGAWALRVTGQDWAGNESFATTPSFQVVSDNTPPQTILTASSPNFGADPIYVSSETLIHLTATDDRTTPGDGLGVGVAETRYAIDGGSYTLYAGAFPVGASGAHAISYFSVDAAGNTEAAQSRNAFVDSAPPATRLTIDGVQYSSGALSLSTGSVVGFAATDEGAGVRETRYALDESTVEVVFTSTFSLTLGTHTLAYRSLDQLSNEESVQFVSLSVFALDFSPPQLSLTPIDGSTTTATTPLIAASYSDAERGVDTSSVRLSLDGVDITTQAAVTASSATFMPAATLAQGAHTVAAQVADLAGNHTSSTSTFLVDSVAPVTTLLVNGLPSGSTNLVLISTDSLGFASTDGGAGVLETRYALDGSTTPLVFSSTFSLTGGTHTLAFYSQDRAGNVEITQAVALNVLGEDVTPPSLSLVPTHGSTVTTTTPQLLATYIDTGRGVDAVSVRLSLDGVDVTTLAFVTASSAAFTPSAQLAQGTHAVSASVSDLAGNGTSASAVFIIDSLSPLSTLLVNDLAAGSTNLVIASTDSLGFSAIDAGTGVLETLYTVDGATETVFVSPFTLSPGGHTLAFHSRDQAGNLEATRSAFFTVTSPSSDTTPPLVRLDFPGGAALGVEQAVGGVVNIHGAASDVSALTWVLEAAPGASATSGFTTIASGVGNISGLIAAWNTSALSGYQTLRLRAIDAFSNPAQTVASVFVGKPVFTFAIGRKDSHVIVNKIKNPTGIAVRSDGHIWVANTDEDRLLLLTSSGTVQADIDGGAGHGHEHGHGHGHDDDDDAEGEQRFKNPQGLAVDAADNLYVADRGNDRVVKLSPDGSQILLQIAKLDHRGRPKPGSGPGELRHPWDAAVDANGDIYVADSGNSRIQVFNSSGAFLRQFGSGVLLSTSEVRGIALTAEGLWVSDKEQERVYLFSRMGALLKSIGDADSAVGELSRMRGLASDRLGALYVVEPNRDRTQKFDPQGKGLLAFGSKTGLSQADKHAKRYLTQPIDAAVAPDGSIWITDTGRDRIVRYALPVSGGYGVAAYSADGGAIVTTESVEPAKRVVDHKDGAKVERDDGAGVSVPKGALSSDLEITVDKGDENLDKEEKTAKRKELKITAVSEEVQYGPEGTVFSAPVTLTLPYNAATIASQGVKEEDLKVYYWNPTLKDWQAMPSTVDKQSKTVSALTMHFSAYQVGGLGGIGVAAIDDFGLRDGYAFPNPSRNGSAVTFRLQPGSVDSIEVRVYDVSGRKIHSSSDFRFRGALDDGNGKGAQNTYDHNWDVSGVGSGVYTFVMTAKKAGQSDIRKTGKVGVIR